ncbi:MAG: RNA-directed DNA polymerase, partial [Candidatus Woesearchaeota archaeon]|nr:RNA-directed DNA polymerase [Candidatus Woesearchaeota archaeon]
CGWSRGFWKTPRGGGRSGRGMPLGNLTSQFFANVYLNELDYFVKYKLRAEYYLRYVDDFIILHNSKEHLEMYKSEIGNFLRENLDIHLHPNKSKISPLSRGTTFLGFRIFYHHKLLKKSNISKFRRKLSELCLDFDAGKIDYDIIYDLLEGWVAYSSHANAHNLKKRVLGFIYGKFEGETSTKEINRYFNMIISN